MDRITITERAAEVLRRGLEAARLDPAVYGIRVWMSAGTVRTGFADEPDSNDATVVAGGVRVFVASSVPVPSAIDVSAEHEQIIVIPLED